MGNRHSLRSADIAVKLTESILVKKEWEPLEKLPNERQLAERFGVSRTSIREAVKTLSAEGLLIVRQGSGTYVSETPGLIPDPLGFADINDINLMLREWYEVRKILESGAMRLVSQRATDEELFEIESLAQKEAELFLNKDRTYLDIDRQFHLALARATHNIIMEKTISSLQQSFYYNVTKAQYLDINSTHRDHVETLHLNITRFLRLRDGAGADAAMKLHMEYAISFL